MTIPAAPRGTGAAGRRLWRAVLDGWQLEEHELSLLREAIRTVDQLDALAAMVERDGQLVAGPSGPRMHPAAVEARQLRIVLARLIVALRVPLGDEEGQSGSPAARPQRRSLRGVYGVRGGAA